MNTELNNVAATFESILLYRSKSMEKTLHGTYSRMLRKSEHGVTELQMRIKYGNLTTDSVIFPQFTSLLCFCSGTLSWMDRLVIYELEMHDKLPRLSPELQPKYSYLRDTARNTPRSENITGYYRNQQQRPTNYDIWSISKVIRPHYRTDCSSDQ